MTTYLLDSDTCIFLLKNKYGIKERIKEAGIENCFVSEITIAELAYGAFKSSRFEKHIAEAEKIEELFGVVPIHECIRLFAQEKARLSRMGKNIPDFDLLIGVTAVQRDMILVTNNTKHMSRIKGIKLENWVKP